MPNPFPDIPPLRQAFTHFPNIGPARLKMLLEAGIRSWEDIGPFPPPELHAWNAFWSPIYQTAINCREADAANDIQFFIERLAPMDRWRLLHKHWSQCAFLDIETSGLDFDAEITVISVFYQHRVHLFVKDENIDDFPDFLLTLPFIATYNGSTFDIPKIIRNFNIPMLPVPHVDLRWLCHRLDLTGGLKPIEHTLGIVRPTDLQGTDGDDAIRLWQEWQSRHDDMARYRLLKYCAADTLSLQLVTDRILEKNGCYVEQRPRQDAVWELLEDIPRPTQYVPPQIDSRSDKATENETLSSLQGRLKALLNRKKRF
ncbi:MAG: ribonuclease H-like domain-containing protein [Victivallales bacterium]|nr:ribonuclease H-like domain-containing protein [Victivallales bacterium]